MDLIFEATFVGRSHRSKDTCSLQVFYSPKEKKLVFEELFDNRQSSNQEFDFIKEKDVSKKIIDEVLVIGREFIMKEVSVDEYKIGKRIPEKVFNERKLKENLLLYGFDIEGNEWVKIYIYEDAYWISNDMYDDKTHFQQMFDYKDTTLEKCFDRAMGSPSILHIGQVKNNTVKNHLSNWLRYGEKKYPVAGKELTEKVIIERVKKRNEAKYGKEISRLLLESKKMIKEKDEIGLWANRWSTARGWNWELERKCDNSNAEEWLNIFRKDEPETTFTLSVKKPKELKESFHEGTWSTPSELNKDKIEKFFSKKRPLPLSKDAQKLAYDFCGDDDLWDEMYSYDDGDDARFPIASWMKDNGYKSFIPISFLKKNESKYGTQLTFDGEGEEVFYDTNKVYKDIEKYILSRCDLSFLKQMKVNIREEAESIYDFYIQEVEKNPRLKTRKIEDILDEYIEDDIAITSSYLFEKYFTFISNEINSIINKQTDLKYLLNQFRDNYILDVYRNMDIESFIYPEHEAILEENNITVSDLEKFIFKTKPEVNFRIESGREQITTDKVWYESLDLLSQTNSEIEIDLPDSLQDAFNTIEKYFSKVHQNLIELTLEDAYFHKGSISSYLDVEYTAYINFENVIEDYLRKNK